MKRIVISCIISVFLIIAMILPAFAGSSSVTLTYSKGTGTTSFSTKTATGTTSASTFAGGYINGVSVRVSLTYGVGYETKTIQNSGGSDTSSYSVSVTAPETYITFLSASSEHYYAAYHNTLGPENTTWNSRY